MEKSKPFLKPDFAFQIEERKVGIGHNEEKKAIWDMPCFKMDEPKVGETLQY